MHCVEGNSKPCNGLLLVTTVWWQFSLTRFTMFQTLGFQTKGYFRVDGVRLGYNVLILIYMILFLDFWVHLEGSYLKKGIDFIWCISTHQHLISSRRQCVGLDQSTVDDSTWSKQIQPCQKHTPTHWWLQTDKVEH